ncbi:hypothetical protein [Terribacillus saccharophilus]|uniref:Uncharacterized protein n=2 Tax=Terribacillus saccharophilus TaxID=361277 RepID=A0AAX2E9R9_9BACI|nr:MULTISPECIES: hypothetical protein [Terribacillus]SEM50523.1 hypothetical protein SAMN04489762_0243 [Terribacillus saccharophilus]
MMRKLAELLFKVFLVAFLACGSLLVFGQILGLILQNGDLIIQSAEWFKNPTIILSAIFSLVGFSLNYLPKKKNVNDQDKSMSGS